MGNSIKKSSYKSRTSKILYTKELNNSNKVNPPTKKRNMNQKINEDYHTALKVLKEMQNTIDKTNQGTRGASLQPYLTSLASTTKIKSKRGSNSNSKINNVTSKETFERVESDVSMKEIPQTEI